MGKDMNIKIQEFVAQTSGGTTSKPDKGKIISVFNNSVNSANDNATYSQNTQEILEKIKEKYSFKNIKKEFPSKKYDVQRFSDCIIVTDKSTGFVVLNIDRSSEKPKVTKYDKAGTPLNIDISNLNETLRSKAKTTKKDCSQITNEIYSDITAKTRWGMPTTGEHIEEHVMQITPENVVSVYSEYSQLAGENILEAISDEIGLDAKVRGKLIKHITDQLLTYYKRQGIYIDDVKEFISNEINYQVNRTGKMNVTNIRTELAKLVRRKEIKPYSEYDVNQKPNGKIDGNFKQGHTGDCWLLASIKSIANNPKGLEMLNECISVDKDGNVKVHLKGPNKTYTITKEELYGSVELSSGDLDVRAIEIAVNKYMMEEYGYGFSLDPSAKNNIDGNAMNTAYDILLGKGKSHTGGWGQLYDRYIRNEDAVIKKAKEGNTIITVAASSEPKCSATDEKGNEVEVHNNHAYSVVGADDNYVYLVNPWDTSKTIKMTHKDFKDTFQSFDMVELD